MKQKTDSTSCPDSQVVNEFVEQFYNGEIKLRLEAQIVMFSNNKVHRSLADLLSEAVTNYTLSKSSLKQLAFFQKKDKVDRALNNVILKELANEKKWLSSCLLYITYARNHDLIVETESMASKLRKVKGENERLKNENDNLRKLNIDLSKENARLHSLFPDNQRGKSEVGDLER